MKKESSFSSRKFKGGAYTTLLSVLVVFVILVVNLIISGVARTKDLTTTGMYSLNESTIKFLEQYDTPVDIMYVTTPGKEDSIIYKTAENYAEDGKNIDISILDPKTYPQQVMKYSGVGVAVNDNSVIVVNRNNPDRFVYIDAESMKQYVISQKDYQTKEFYGYCAEAEIMKALVNVSDSNNANVYIATGHGEQLLSSDGKVTKSFSDLLALNSYNIKYVDLKKTDIPADCQALILFGPVNDFTEEECELIKSFMTAGGRVLWALSYVGVERPMQEALLNHFGLHMEEALVCEGDTNHTASNNASYILTSYGKNNVQWALGTGVTKCDNQRDSLKVSPIYTTTNQGFLTTNLEDLSYENGTKKGVYYLLTKVEEEYKGQTGMMYVINTYFFLHDNCIKANASYANAELFMQTLGDLCNIDSNVSIPDNRALEEALTMTTHSKNLLLIIFVGVIPGIILLCGIVVVIMRRR